MRFDWDEEDHRDLEDRFERQMEGEKKYEGLTTEEMEDLRLDERERKDHCEMILDSWHY